jgi:hypothetical protein
MHATTRDKCKTPAKADSDREEREKTTLHNGKPGGLRPPPPTTTSYNTSNSTQRDQEHRRQFTHLLLLVLIAWRAAAGPLTSKVLFLDSESK